ncbi:MAG: exonuclease SbcCD subunit D [Anaeroplasma sp.]
MKIIHTADLHLDSSLESNLDSIKAKERKRELLLNFERLVSYANTNNIEAIIIAGDLFDKPRVSIKTKDYVMDIIESNRNIDFIYLSGNHDEDVFFNFLEQKPDNLLIFDSKWKTINYKDVDITGISKTFTKSDTMYDLLNLDKNRLNIVVMHGDIESEINLTSLKHKNIDYLALGHIHKYQKGELDERGTYVYSGCLEGRGFDEIGPKGFVLLETSIKKIKSQFIPFSKRELREINVDISDSENWSEIRRKINIKLNSVPKTDMVKIKLTGYYDLRLIKQIELLTESLNEQFYFAKVDDRSKLRINPMDYENDISLKGEFIRNVLASGLSDEEKNQVIEYGIKALMKEEI